MDRALFCFAVIKQEFTEIILKINLANLDYGRLGGLIMRKILVALIAAFLFAVWFLNYQGTIDFGVIYIISRIWFIIPLWYGIKLIIRNENLSKRNSGIILAVSSGFLQILSMIDIFSKTKEHVFYIAVVGMLAFWPIFLIVFFISVIISLFDKGETVYKSIFSSKTIQNAKWDMLDTSLQAVFGKLKFVINQEDITHRAIRLDVLAVFGKVEIIIPEGVGVLAEAKTRLGTAHILDTKSRKIIGESVIQKPVVSEPNPRLLLVTSSWLLGNVTVKHAG